MLLLGYGEQIGSYEKEIDNIDSPVLDSSLKSPSNKGDFLIVTTLPFKKTFEEFSSAREKKFQVKIVTKDQILAEFPDTKEEVSIKNFLKYAVQNWEVPPQYVILGGNVDQIPTYIRTYDAAQYTFRSLLCGFE